MLKAIFCVYIWYTWNPWAHGWLLFWLVGPSLGGLVPPKTSRTRLDLWECHPRIGWCLYQSTRVLRWGGFRVAPTWGDWKQIGGRLSCLLISSTKTYVMPLCWKFLSIQEKNVTDNFEETILIYFDDRRSFYLRYQCNIGNVCHFSAGKDSFETVTSMTNVGQRVVQELC